MVRYSPSKIKNKLKKGWSFLYKNVYAIWFENNKFFMEIVEGPDVYKTELSCKRIKLLLSQECLKPYPEQKILQIMEIEKKG